MAKHLLLKDFLDKERQRVKTTSQKTATISEIHLDTKMSTGSLHGYLNGNVIPDPEKASALAKYFYPEESVGYRIFLDKIDEFRQGGNQDVLTRLSSDKPALSAGIINYPPFCRAQRGDSGSRSGILDAIVRRFALLAGLRLNEADPTIEEDAVKALTTGRIDLLVSLFQTYQRGREIVTFTTPLRTSLNAVCIDFAGGQKPATTSHIRDLLATDNPKFAERQSYSDYEFSGLKNEVGYSFLKDVVKRDPANILLLKSLQAEQWLAELLLSKEVEFPAELAARIRQAPAAHQQWFDDVSKAVDLCKLYPLPIVVVTDEFLSLRFAASLPPKVREKASIVWPLVTAETADSLERRSSPLYPMGLISVSRAQDGFVRYLADSLRLLLRTDVEFISDLFVNFYKELRDELKSSIKETRKDNCLSSSEPDETMAIRVATYALGLVGPPTYDMGATGDLPWDAVISRVHAKLGPIEEAALSGSGLLHAIARPMPLLYHPPETVDSKTTKAGPLDVCLRAVKRHFRLEVTTVNTAEALRRRAEALVGFFGTPRRAENWEFLPSPVWLPLGIVSIGARMHEEISIHEIQSSSLFVHSQGAAQEYLADRLGITAFQPVERLSPEEMANLVPFERTRGKPSMVIIDVIHCLKVLRHLQDRTRREQVKLELNFLWVDWPEREESAANRAAGNAGFDVDAYISLPSFPLSSAVHATVGKAKMLDRVLRMDLACDAQRAALEYASAVNTLERGLAELMRAAGESWNSLERAQKWASRICSVDEFALGLRRDSLGPWLPICEMVNRMRSPQAPGSI